LVENRDLRVNEGAKNWEEIFYDCVNNTLRFLHKPVEELIGHVDFNLADCNLRGLNQLPVNEVLGSGLNHNIDSQIADFDIAGLERNNVKSYEFSI
jgi:hypothetical protein